VIVREGMRRMLEAQEDVFYYVTVMNENYPQPAIEPGAEEGILRGMHQVRAGNGVPGARRVRLLGSGTILREVLAAADIVEASHGVDAEVWSVTSFTELRRDGLACDAWNLAHPHDPRQPWIARCLAGSDAPVIAATDYVRALPDLVRGWVPGRYVTLGTDGFGRSDTRQALRAFFGVDAKSIVEATVATLQAA
jgi:pyruvate dehydrogenase E1 component